MISVNHLTKYYGEYLALDDISFAITEGHVYGFLGPNGAGKSTTMNIITGCLSATEGTVLIDGHDIFEEPDKAKRLIGYLPEHPPLYMNESPLEYLKFVGEAKGLRGAALMAQVSEAMEKTGISSVKNRRISTLSKGYKQRVGIAQALLGNPKVIILDEPTVGLDPIQIIEIRDLITELGKTHTVIFSSHILTEVQAICDQIIMIAGGRLVAFGEPEQLKQQLLAKNEILLTTDAAESEIRELLAKTDGIAEITAEEGKAELTVVHIKAASGNIYDLSSAVFRAIAASDKVIYEMTLKKGNLEDVFIELSENPVTESEKSAENLVTESEKSAENPAAEKKQTISEEISKNLQQRKTKVTDDLKAVENGEVSKE